MSKIKRIKFRRSDFKRAILTDTLPYEVPLLFSNDGFYERVTKGTLEKISENSKINFFDGETASIAYTYHIKKDELSLRSLSVMHPAIQLKIADFYKTHSKLIVGLCNRSSFSLRKPYRVASHFYEKNRASKYIVEKEMPESAVESKESQQKNSSSFFTYKDYVLIHRFYESAEFHELEKKYKFLRTLDISKCFPHIYTHSISWAVRNKAFAKENRQAETFDAKFDEIMRYSNHDETNGIIIGPETSRIFAEIILQGIDINIENSLRGFGLVYGRDYSIRRYVDDYFIFSNSTSVLDIIEKQSMEDLEKYKLYLNEVKTKTVSRPFITGQTSAKIEIANIIDDFFSKHVDTRKVVKERVEGQDSSVPAKDPTALVSAGGGIPKPMPSPTQSPAIVTPQTVVAQATPAIPSLVAKPSISTSPATSAKAAATHTSSLAAVVTPHVAMPIPVPGIETAPVKIVMSTSENASVATQVITGVAASALVTGGTPAAALGTSTEAVVAAPTAATLAASPVIGATPAPAVSGYTPAIAPMGVQKTVSSTTAEALKKPETLIYDHENESLINESTFPIRYIGNYATLSATYIRRIKSVVSANFTSFDHTSNYFFSVIRKTTLDLLERIDVSLCTVKEIERCIRFIKAILEIIFFVFSMSPKVRTTYQICQICLALSKFAKILPPEQQENLLGSIAIHLRNAIFNFTSANEGENVEMLNLLILLHSVGPKYSLSPGELCDFFGISVDKKNSQLIVKKDFRYFQIVSIIYYMEDSEKYSEIKLLLHRHIHELVANVPSVKGLTISSDYVMLIFDYLRCPYVEKIIKVNLAKLILKRAGDINLNARCEKFLAAIDEGDWFFAWKSRDLLGAVLWKKELRPAY